MSRFWFSTWHDKMKLFFGLSQFIIFIFLIVGYFFAVLFWSAEIFGIDSIRW